MSEKDVSVLEHIIKYCDSIGLAVKRFGNTFENFENDESYRHSTSMCIQQIGELAKLLSHELKTRYDKMPWSDIRGMRNMMAHGYWKMSYKEIWNVIENDIPELKSYCQKILEQKNDIS